MQHLFITKVLPRFLTQKLNRFSPVQILKSLQAEELNRPDQIFTLVHFVILIKHKVTVKRNSSLLTGTET